MPRYCRTKAKEFSDNELVSRSYETVCDFLLPWFGIDPGSDDEESWLVWIWKGVIVIFDPNSCWFQIFVLLLCTLIAFSLGIYIR